MIKIYKYKRSELFVKAENVVYVPKYKVVIKNLSCSADISEDERLIAEGEKIVSDINKKGVNVYGKKYMYISDVYEIDYEEIRIREFINCIKERNKCNSCITEELKTLGSTKPTTISFLKLNYDVTYTCKCGPDDTTCIMRLLKLEETILILPSNNDDTLKDLNYDYAIIGGSRCKETPGMFGLDFGKRYVQEKKIHTGIYTHSDFYSTKESRIGYPNMKLSKLEIIKDVPYIDEYSKYKEFGEFMSLLGFGEIAFTKE